MDMVSTWNEKVFEGKTVFGTGARAAECLEMAFRRYLKNMYRHRSPKPVVSVNMPSNAAYVQALLTEAAAHPFILSGRYFEAEPMQQEHCLMSVIRKAMEKLRDDYVLETEAPECHDQSSDVGPDDSASNLGTPCAQVQPDGADGTGGAAATVPMAQPVAQPTMPMTQPVARPSHRRCGQQKRRDSRR